MYDHQPLRNLLFSEWNPPNPASEVESERHARFTYKQEYLTDQFFEAEDTKEMLPLPLSDAQIAALLNEPGNHTSLRELADKDSVMILAQQLTLTLAMRTDLEQAWGKTCDRLIQIATGVSGSFKRSNMAGIQSLVQVGLLTAEQAAAPWTDTGLTLGESLYGKGFVATEQFVGEVRNGI